MKRKGGMWAAINRTTAQKEMPTSRQKGDPRKGERWRREKASDGTRTEEGGKPSLILGRFLWGGFLGGGVLFWGHWRDSDTRKK